MMHKILFAALVCAAVGLSAAPVAPECVDTKGAKVEDGVVKLSTAKGRFCYVVFKLPEAVKFDPAQSMTFEFRMTTAGEEATFVNQLVFGKKQTWNGNKVTGEWQKVKFPFTRARFEKDSGGGNPQAGDMITGLKFYGRTKANAEITIEIRNIEILDPSKK